MKRGLFRPMVLPILLAFASPGHAATFIVENVSNSGAGSLRQAILEANSVVLPESVLIRFDISLGMFMFPVINPTSPLPTLLRPMTIDGTTQPNFARVAVQGINAGADADGLHLGPNADGSIIRGLVLNSWTDDGIEFEQCDNAVVAGCWIGIDFLIGLIDLGNMQAGVHINNSDGVQVGGITAADRNIISGNGGNGVWILNGSTGNRVIGNYIGTDSAGTVAIPNTNNGVLIVACSDNSVGGPTGDERNTISGNGNGVTILGANARNNRIQTNFIGTDATGQADLGNLVHGVRINLAQNTLIGGNAPPNRLPPGNVISGNGMAGVLIQSTSVTTIQGNIIGQNADASLDLANGDEGIKQEDDPMFPGFDPRGTVIGGRGGMGNIISNNEGSGVWIEDGTGVQVQGNSIQGNQGFGVRIQTDQNVVGGPSRDDGNVIAHNSLSGIRIQSGNANLIGGATGESGTYIYGNGEHGIRLSSTANQNRIEGCNIGRDDQGVAFGNASYGIVITGNPEDNIVGGTDAAKSNTIVGNVDGGVLIEGNAERNRIIGNGIGTSTDIVNKGSYSNLHGVVINDASNNFIGGSEPGEGNVISGNDGIGVFIHSGAANNQVQGNLIGLFAAGMVPFGNTTAGISILDSPANLIGGTEPGARNVISANGDGIFIMGGTQSGNNRIQGNYIGTDATGLLDRGNINNGVFASVADLILGGTESGARNVIAGNNQNGVFLSGGSAMDCRVVGNYIGTDVTGQTALENGDDGVLLVTAFHNQIGGPGAGAGNVISGNAGNGVRLNAFSQHNVVAGNRIGTDAAGNASLGNGEDAVKIEDAQMNRIGGALPGAGNILSGTNQYGIWINHPLAKQNRIEGNFIGTNATGSAPLGNKVSGILITDASDNVIGGASPGSGNVISGNGDSGIRMFKMMNTPGRTAIQGNYIGTDAAGVLPIGNGSRGIDLSLAVGVVIGGVTEGARNVISGNASAGVLLRDTSRDSRVLGNRIGVNAAGNAAVPNGLDGVFIENAPANQIGGATPGAENIISGNQRYGVYLLDAKAIGNRIAGNRIGTDAAGTAGIGNASAGIYIKAATGNLIGDTGENAGNRIAHNLSGVVILSGSMNRILSNSIESNDGLGIDLGEDGITANDEIDSDTGANQFQNRPVLLSANAGEVLAITGTLHSATGTEFLLQFFRNSACDDSGSGEGAMLIGSTTVVTDASGDAAFSVALAIDFEGSAFLTGTATDPSGNTSEFSECLEVVGLPTSTPTETATATPTVTATPTPSPTGTQTPTITATPSSTVPLAPTSTQTITETPTITHTPNGSETTTPTLTPTGTCAPDYDLSGDSEIDARDLLALLDLIGSASPTADFNCDGAVDGLDLIAFSSNWKN